MRLGKHTHFQPKTMFNIKIPPPPPDVYCQSVKNLATRFLSTVFGEKSKVPETVTGYLLDERPHPYYNNTFRQAVRVFNRSRKSGPPVSCVKAVG